MERDDAIRVDDLLAEAQEKLCAASTILAEQDDFSHLSPIQGMTSHLNSLRVSFRKLNKLA